MVSFQSTVTTGAYTVKPRLPTMLAAAQRMLRCIDPTFDLLTGRIQEHSQRG